MVNRARYVERKILCEYDLREEFFEHLGLKIEDMIPLRKVFILFSDKGKLILKLTNLSSEKIEFISKSLNYVKEKNSNILQYRPNKNGEIVTRWDNKNFVLLELIEGREASYTNPVEVELCAKAAAGLHEASNGISVNFNEDEIKVNTGNNLLVEFNNNLVLLNEIERVVNKFKYKNKFDIMFLSSIEKGKLDIQKSIELLYRTKYEDLFLNGNKVLCHNDLAHHNFILDNDTVNIIDFDYSKLDLRIVDIYNYVVKVLKSYAYDGEIIKLIINSYSEVSEISNDEIDILYSLINYPRDLVNISRDYYLKQKPWEEEVFISRLENKIELDPFRTELLKDIVINRN